MKQPKYKIVEFANGNFWLFIKTYKFGIFPSWTFVCEKLNKSFMDEELKSRTIVSVKYE